MNKKYKVASLFSGCGGMDLGFIGGFEFNNKFYEKNNFEIIWANDIFRDACITYREYFKHDIVCGDIVEILKGNSIYSLPDSADIVLGGFPCQDFSLAGKRRGFDNPKRGLLYKSMVEVVDRLRPSVFVAENVKGLLTMNNGDAIRQIIKDFEELGYKINPNLYLAANYGVPQMRERILLIGTDITKLPVFTHPSPIKSKEHWVSVREAISDLEDKEEHSIPNHSWSKAKLNRGQGNNKVHADKPGPTMRAEHHGNIEYHYSKDRRLSAREAARIQTFPDNMIFYPSTSSAYKQVGNAVPPVLGWHVAQAIQQFLDNNLRSTHHDIYKQPTTSRATIQAVT